MKRCAYFCFVLALFFFLTPSIHAKDNSEHPMIKPYPGSVLAKNMSKYQKFTEFEFTVLNKATKKREKRKIQGEYWSLLYEVRKPNGDRVKDISRPEFFQNYKNAATQAGGEVLFEDNGSLHFRIPKEDGGFSWCRITVNAGLGQVYMNIIDEKGFEGSIIFGPDKIKEVLDKDGKVLLYGILFDLDKSSLKQESEKQLSNIVSLMLRYPMLKLEIQGHTDNQGDDDYNLKLSQARAETVVAYLKLFGIHGNRLKAKGRGETMPVASNETEAGRAKNRRVELSSL